MNKLEYDLGWLNKVLQNFDEYGKHVTDADIRILKKIADDLQEQIKIYNDFINNTQF